MPSPAAPVTGAAAGARPRVPALDALRGIAVLLVLVHHFAIVEPPTAAAATAQAVLRLGWCGVDLFFVLSGFLITGILCDSRGRPGYFRSFYERRARRIFPLYFGTLAALVFVAPHLGEAARRVTASLVDTQWWYWTYLSNVLIARTGDWSAGPVTNHFWSLAVEEQFYIVWPVLVLLLSPRTLGRVCAGVIVGALALRIALVLAGVSGTAVYVLTPARMDSLALGALLALAARAPELRARVRRYAPRAAAAAAAALLPIAVVSRGDRDHALIATVGYTALALLFGAAVWAAAVEPESRLPRWLAERGGLRRLGIYSYGVYVFQYPLRTALGVINLGPDDLAARFGYVGGQLAFLVVGVVSSIALAAVSWHVLESRLLAPTRPVAAPARAERAPEPADLAA